MNDTKSQPLASNDEAEIRKLMVGTNGCPVFFAHRFGPLLDTPNILMFDVPPRFYRSD